MPRASIGDRSAAHCRQGFLVEHRERPRAIRLSFISVPQTSVEGENGRGQTKVQLGRSADIFKAIGGDVVIATGAVQGFHGAAVHPFGFRTDDAEGLAGQIEIEADLAGIDGQDQRPTAGALLAERVRVEQVVRLQPALVVHSPTERPVEGGCGLDLRPASSGTGPRSAW